ncbi:Cobyrinic acid a,c-diamide synthase OS=Streptomyces alboniger OX=132473 GN=CP975_07340 PE=4 SV=1 [Streptomyces alboniger]
MSRRVSLPGADELFRTTGGMALQSSSPRRPANGEARVPAPAGESDETAAAADEPAQGEGGEPAEHAATDAEAGAESRSRAASADADKGAGRRSAGQAQEGAAPQGGGKNGSSTAQARRRARAANRRPSGRERHDEKITVYVSAEELMDLEHARLVLRGEHGLAVDRGRIVREAVAVVLADLESRGDASILVRRLRGR